MVQFGTELVEQLAPVGRAVRVQREQGAAWQREDDVVELLVMTVQRGDRLVEDGFRAQQALVPLAATSMASRVLPTPPGPVSVTSRAVGRSSSPRNAAASRSRPTIAVNGTGR